MKVRASVKKMCDDCKVVKRKPIPCVIECQTSSTKEKLFTSFDMWHPYF